MSSTYGTRYEQLRTQSAYERRVTARGMDALLAPYVDAGVPAQREPDVAYAAADNDR